MRFRRRVRGSYRLAPRALRAAAAHPDLSLVLDEPWYLARHPDVLNSGLTARNHFLASGVHEWRNPSPFVDLKFVAEFLPQQRRSGSAALLFLLERGIDRGAATSPFVDLDWYGRQHGINARDHRARFTHLATIGKTEGHAPSPWFDLEWYASRYPEIRLGGLDAFQYFLMAGQWRQRFPHPSWDEERYVALNEYVRAAIGSGKYASGFEHFCASGWREASQERIALPLRISGEDKEYVEGRYLAVNPDVEASTRSGDLRSGLEHLMTIGHRQVAQGTRRLNEPSPFAASTYRPGRAPATGRWLVLLNHHDVDGEIDDHVSGAIDVYRDAGADVALITTGASEDARTRLNDRLLGVLTKSRNDDLRDFGGWHLAFEQFGTEALLQYERVILTNDSVYFPVRDPEPFLAALRQTDADVFGATDSVSGGEYHLQSYFLALSRSAVSILLPELAHRIAQQAEGSKLTLVRRFEIGMCHFLIEAGATTEVYVPFRNVEDLSPAICPPDNRLLSREASMHLNITHHLWSYCLDKRLPFLKVELLRDNPVEVEIDGWEDVVDGPCDADLIRAHLARVRR